MAHLLRVAAAVLAAWVVLSVPLGVLLGRWLRRASRPAGQAAWPGEATASRDPAPGHRPAHDGPFRTAENPLRAVPGRPYDRPMSPRSFRVTVRGSFEALSDQQRAELLADAAQHDMLFAAFTPEGHLSYDLRTRPFFTFRFLESGESADDLPAAIARAEATARAWLEDRGYGYRIVKTQGEDLAEAAIGRRQRRAARRAG